MAKKLTIFLTFLLIVSLVALVVYQVIGPETPSSSKQEPKGAHSAPQKTVAKTSKQPASSAKTPASPAEKTALPPPDVRWSVFSRQLLNLEQERVEIFKFILEKLPPPVEAIAEVLLPSLPENPELSTSSTTPAADKVPIMDSSEVTWSHIGRQVVELEEQREQTLTLLVDELVKNRRTPAKFEKE